MSSNQPPVAPVLHRRARSQLMMLTIQFLLGMGVNLIGLPSETSGLAKGTTSALLGLHILVSLGLIVVAALTIWRSGPLDRQSTNQAWVGGILIVISTVAGVLATSAESNWWSYLMAVGFIASFVVYGNLLLRTRPA